jgi:hypothetical protein
VERRAVAGSVTARRVGERTWQINMNGERMTTTSQTSADRGPVRYRVLAPYVNVRTGGAGAAVGAREDAVNLGYYKNSILPPNVDREDVDRLLRKQMIEPIKEN